jgi:5-methylcytosine-specific restriction endonuclease McrA
MWQVDHTIPLIQGGENREKNLQAICLDCHLIKTKAEVAEKSKTARIRKKHLGLRKAKGRPLPGTKASGIRKRMDGKVEKR